MNRYERLGELMESRGVDAVVLRRPANFAWYTGGADSKVDHVAPEGVADLVVRGDSTVVLTSTIEAPRMRAEQTPGLEVVEYEWYGDRDAALRALVGEATLAGDMAIRGAVDLGDEIARIRRTLDPGAIDNLREIGRDLSAAMGETAARVEPGGWTSTRPPPRSRARAGAAASRRPSC
jgi:Xaa-Pro dipeptidase